jgi:SHAQKYF class myb-like DNA-binding protein
MHTAHTLQQVVVAFITFPTFHLNQRVCICIQQTNMSSSSTATTTDSTSCSVSVPNPFVPSRLMIPDASFQPSEDHDSPMEISPPSTPTEGDSSKENVGRWSEEEHQVFIQGLERYGKQWKTIANMIGTRTVVQVRTHAQKYFQKMERKTKPGSPDPKETPVSAPALKRKSLPASLPSRKKGKSPKKTRSTSVSLSGLSSSPPPDL